MMRSTKLSCECLLYSLPLETAFFTRWIIYFPYRDAEVSKSGYKVYCS